MGWSGRESRKQGRSGTSSGRGESGAGSGKLPLSGGASRQRASRREEDGSTVGMRPQARPRRRRPAGRAHGRRPCAQASPQAAPAASRPASSVVEGEEDAGAAPQGGCGLLNALGAQGGAGGNAPPGNRKPVEDAFGEHRPSAERSRAAQAQAPAWDRGAPGTLGQRRGLRPAPQATAQVPRLTSGTTTIPANRSEPRSVNRPESLMPLRR